MFKFRFKTLFLFFISIILIGIASTYKSVTETVYTNLLNRLIREGLSTVSGKLSFPVGEILYVIILCLVVLLIIYFIKKLISTLNIFESIGSVLFAVINISSIVLFMYILLYGLNYYTTPLQEKMIKMYNEKYATNISINVDNQKMVEVYNFLEQKAIETKKLANATNEGYSINDIQSLSDKAQEGFRIISEKFPMMSDSYSPAKIAIGSGIYDYFGYDANYYLLTGEVVVNKDVPKIYLPFVVSKYMAYQRGAAREDEDCFYAYISCINSSSPEFKYSGYISAIYYFVSTLRVYDRIEYNTIIENMNPEIKKDLETIESYKSSYESGYTYRTKFSKVFKRLNGDIRTDELDHQVSVLISSYYSLFTY